MKTILVLFFTICVLFESVAQQKNFVKILSSDADAEIIRKAAEVVPSGRQLRSQQLELTAFFILASIILSVKNAVMVSRN